jgi:hypothetical protein
MKVEYIGEGSHDCPLIAIFGTSTADFARLRAAAEGLANGSFTKSELQEFEGFHLVNIRSFTMAAGQGSEGLYHRDGASFLWVLPGEKWKIVSGLIEPFTRWRSGSPVHQWLYGGEARLGLNSSEISIVISNSPTPQW